MRTTERLEILMATYNGVSFLQEQIDSILNQSDGDWHLTISDDGSNDKTPAIIDEYVHRYPDKISRHIACQHFGNARDHFFHLMNQCTADWILFCDQDDTWFPDKIEKVKQIMCEAETHYGKDTPLLVFSDQTPTDAQLNPLAPSLMRYQKQYFKHFDYRSILMQNVVTGGAMGINRALAVLGGQCTDTSRVIMHDWWLAAVAARFGKIVYLDESLGAYRQHDDNAVGAKRFGSAQYILQKLLRAKELRQTIWKKKVQASVFRNTYSDSLTAQDQQFLRGFEKRHSGLRFYWKTSYCIHGMARKIGFALLG